MELCELTKLSLIEQATLAWNKGVRLGYRSKCQYYMVLYRLCDLFVEVQYQISRNEIVSVRAFVCDEELQPYLEQIDLSELTELL